jgi:antitoxin ParD1/3/4
MPRSINLSLTDELRAFIDANSGDGTMFATPSEFVRALIRERKERQDAATFRQAVIEGYDDVRAGRIRPFSGDLRSTLDSFRAQRKR